MSFTQGEIDEAVKLLLSLKGDYKEKTGQDYKPGHPPVAQNSLPQASNTVASGPDTTEAKALFNKVALQGDEVRKLKSEKAEKVKNKNKTKQKTQNAVIQNAVHVFKSENFKFKSKILQQLRLSEFKCSLYLKCAFKIVPIRYDPWYIKTFKY